MKYFFIFLMCFFSISFSSPIAVAATSNFPNAISLNGTVFTTTRAIVAKDPASHIQTTYMPIIYIMDLLHNLGIENTWNGSKHQWQLTVPSNRISPSLVYPSKVHPNNVMIYVNGKPLLSSYSVVAPDPRTGVQTTFVPIWYIMQLLKELNFHSTWKNGNWSILDLNPLARALQITANASPKQSNIVMNLQLHVVLNAKGIQTVGNPNSTITNETMTVHTTVDTGLTSSGLPAQYLTSTYSDNQNTSDTQTDQLLTVNQSVYENPPSSTQPLGSGWVNETNQPNSLSFLQNSIPNTSVPLSSLHDFSTIFASQSNQYTAILSPSTLSNEIADVAWELADSGTSQSQLQPMVSSALKTVTGTVSYTVIPTVTPNSNLVSNQTMTLKMNFPLSSFPQTPDIQQMEKDVTGIEVLDTISVVNTFANTIIPIPSSLPIS